MADQIVALEKKSTAASKQANSLVVETKEQYTEAGEMLLNVGKLKKAVAADKDAVLKPLNEAVKKYRAKYKPFEDQIAGAEFALKSKMSTFLRKQQAAEQAEAAKVEAKLDAGRIKPETAVKKLENIERIDNTNTDLGLGTTTIKIVDITDVDAFPWLEYVKRPKVLDAIMVEVRKDVLGNKTQGIEPITVKGVTVTEEKQVTL